MDGRPQAVERTADNVGRVGHRSRSPAVRLGVCLVLVLVLVLAGGAPLSAQVVRGSVADAESGDPVPLAYVGLLEPGRELVVAALADVDGSFSLEAPAHGSYLLYVTRAGYRTVLDGVFELGEDGVFEVAVGLAPAPFEMESVIVEVEGVRDLRTVGFYERRQAGIGHFFEREEIARLAVDDLTDALRGIPSFRIVTPVTSLLSPSQVMSPEVLVRRGGDYCSPTLFVDGHAVAHGSRHSISRTAIRPGDFVDPYDVEAVEVYVRSAETPPQFEAVGGCGAMLVWTRKR